MLSKTQPHGEGMIRVLHVHTMPIVSGSGINTFLSMKGVDPERFISSLACAPGGRLMDLVREHGMQAVPFPSFVQPVSPRNDLRALWELTRHLRRERYDIVHTHNSKTGFIGRLAARLAGVPAVVHTVHGFAFHESETPIRRWLFRTLERLAAPWADHTIFISKPLVEWARQESILKNGAPHSVVYSGIDLDHFHPVDANEKQRLRERLGLKPDHFVAGIVSKLWEGKGHDTLLTAFAQVIQQFPQARLLVVGEGYLRPQLERLAADLGIADKVIFTGFMQDVRPAAGAMDVSVLPSLFEGMGRVLLEAGAMGLPVVASRVGGIPDVVADGQTGLLVPPSEPKPLAQALCRLFGDPGYARTLGSQALARTGEHFSATAMAREIQKIYLDVLERKGVSA